MTEPTEIARGVVARWTGVDPDKLEVSAKPCERGTLVSALAPGPGGENADERSERWFAARTLYVEDGTGAVYRVPNVAATPARIEALLADPKRRERARLTAEEMH